MVFTFAQGIAAPTQRHGYPHAADRKDAVPKHSGPDAVLWDMDGTLVDTEEYWIAAEYDVVERHGGTWNDEHAEALVGADLLDAGRYMRQHSGIDLTPEQIVDELLDVVVERIRTNIPWRPGARELLAALNAAGVPCALVTMSWRRFAEPVVEALPPGSFQVIVTGDEVSHGKPHPEPYLEAARLLGVTPQRCLAIEDSPTGAASATAAGCVVVGVPNVVQVPPAPGRILLSSLTELDLDGVRRLFTPRRRRRLTLAVTAAAALLAAGAGAWTIARDDSPPRPVVPLPLDGWAPGWAWANVGNDWATTTFRVNEFSPFWLQATGVDTIEPMPGTNPTRADELMATARRAGARIVPSIVDGLPAGGMAAIVRDPRQRARHVAAVAALARQGNWDGVDLDYEQFAFADGRDSWADTSPAWIAFVTELAEVLRAEGRTLTVTVPPVYGPGRSDAAGYWVYDHAALARVADRVRIMAYDFSTSNPGPIAPLPWVQRVIDGVVQVTGQPDKVVLGIPVYGYNWPTGATGTCPPTTEGRVGVTARTVGDLIARRGLNPVFDDTTGEWAAVYDVEVSDGTTTCVQARRVHWVDGAGAAARVRLAQQAGLGGVALWALGYEDDAVWSELDPLVARP
jgi:HAD superfamily hydrolase (TIGR01509 family)